MVSPKNQERLLQVLLPIVRERIQLKRYSDNTEQAYTGWVKKYIIFHGSLHPRDMGRDHIEAFLTHLALKRGKSRSTQNQALHAILFLYREVLRIELPRGIHGVRAKIRRRLPTVLTQEEAARFFKAIAGLEKLVCMLLYGSGLRIHECLHLRVEDIDFGAKSIHVRKTKGGDERSTVLPGSVLVPLEDHLTHVRVLHEGDRKHGHGWAILPDGQVSQEWPMQLVFPGRSREKLKGTNFWARRSISAYKIQKAVREAAQLAGIKKHVTPHVLRHSFATHLLLEGYNIRVVQDLLGHRQGTTTMKYLHVIDHIRRGVRSPLDR